MCEAQTIKANIAYWRRELRRAADRQGNLQGGADARRKWLAKCEDQAAVWFELWVEAQR